MTLKEFVDFTSHMSPDTELFTDDGLPILLAIENGEIFLTGDVDFEDTEPVEFKTPNSEQAEARFNRVNNLDLSISPSNIEIDEFLINTLNKLS